VQGASGRSLPPIQGQTFDARRRRPLDNTWEQVSSSQQATQHWQQYLLKSYRKWHQTIIESKQKSKSWRLRLITKSDCHHQDTRDKTRASKTWSEIVASQVKCQPCPRSQLLAVYYEEQQQSRENVPRACPRKNVHIFFGNTSLNMCAMFLHAVFFCKSQNLRLGTGHSAEKIRTQRIFCCLSFGLLGRRHLLWRYIWHSPRNLIYR